MSVSYSICTKVQAERNIWAVEKGHRRNHKKLCEQKGVEIIEAEACPDHIHMLVSIPPYISIAQFMGFLKGKSSLMIFDRHANLKYKYGSRHFWCRGYYVDTVGKNIEEDYASDQISIKEFTDPFTGSKNK